MTQDKPLWSVNDVAKAANLTAGRVRQLLIAGEIAGFKVGRAWLIDREEALRFIETHEKYKQTQKEEDPEQGDEAISVD